MNSLLLVILMKQHRYCVVDLSSVIDQYLIITSANTPLTGPIIFFIVLLMQNTTLIIAGMHRSGTSLITNWLNKCGLQCGETMVGPCPSNLDGHFEDIEFLKLHEEILADNHLPATGLTEQHPNDISIYHKEKLKTIIKVKNKLYKQWGWKDPRTVLFLDTYKELLPNARYLIIIRDYKSVVSSLLQRDFKDIDKRYMARSYFKRMIWKHIRRKRRLEAFYNERAEYYLKVWIAYNEELLKSVKTLSQDSYVVLNYSFLTGNDDRVCSYLKEHWHMSLKYFKFNEVYKEKLINEPIDTDSFIENKPLLYKAAQLENNLMNYLTMV